MISRTLFRSYGRGVMDLAFYFNGSCFCFFLSIQVNIRIFSRDYSLSSLNRNLIMIKSFIIFRRSKLVELGGSPFISGWLLFDSFESRYLVVIIWMIRPHVRQATP